MKKLWRVMVFSVGLFAFTSASFAPSAHALRTRTKIVRSVTYGAAAGLAAGIVSWPISGDSNAIWAGLGVGLVLGLGYGIYWSQNPDEFAAAAHEAIRAGERGQDPVLLARATDARGAGGFARAAKKGNGAGVSLAAPIYSFSF